MKDVEQDVTGEALKDTEQDAGPFQSSETPAGRSLSLLERARVAAASLADQGDLKRPWQEVTVETDEDLLELDELRRTLVLEGVEMARTYLRAGSFCAAEDACLATIEQVPEYLPVQALLAETYVQEGDIQRAIEKYDYLIELYRVRGNKRKAIEILRQELCANPDDEAKRLRLITWMMDEGLVDQALREMSSVAKAYLDSGEVEAGLRLYDQMIQEAPDNAWIRRDFGRALEGIGRRADALAHYLRSWELEPANPEACWRALAGKLLEGDQQGLESVLDTLLASIVPEMDQTKTAVEALRSTLGDSPIPTTARLCLTAVLAEAGEWRESEALLQEVIGDKDELREDGFVSDRVQLMARLRLGLAMIGDNQFDRAAVALAPGCGTLRSALGEGRVPMSMAQSYLQALRDAYEHNQDARGTAWVLKEMKTLLPIQEGLGLDLAVLYFDLGQIREGVEELLEVADKHRQNGDLDEELRVLLDYGKRAPGDVGICERVCDIMVGLGRFAEVVPQIELLAERQHSAGRLLEAAATLRRLWEIEPAMDRSKMFNLCERIVDLDPSDTASLVRLAESSLWRGQATKALALSLAAARMATDSGDLCTIRDALLLAVKVDPWNIAALEQLRRLEQLRSMR